MTQELNEFCSDPTLVELLEISKSTDDLLDLLTPRENQHSDLMEWCFNAREGHGQGDAILKDFLLALYRSASESEAGDRLSGRGLSRDFVRAWPPTRVMASSFSTAFCYREYPLPKGPGEKNAKRLDMLVIDPDNQFIVVIENKAGAKFGEGQLEGYLEGMQKTLLSKRAFSNFHVAFVAMDRDAAIGDDAGDGNGNGIDGRWVRLNYEWLRPAAQRAQVAVQRGNQSAALLLSYCRRQTGWESESMQAMTRLAQDLAIRFPGVTKEFKRISNEFSNPDSWVPAMMKPDDTNGQLVKFYRQYESAIDLMLQLTPVQLLRGRLVENVPELESDEDAYEYGRVWAGYRLPIEHLLSQDYRWPLYLAYRHLNPGSDSAAKFRVRLVFGPCDVPENERARVCEDLGRYYPPAATAADRQNRLILVKEECSFERALDLGLEIIRRTGQALMLQD